MNKKIKKDFLQIIAFGILLFCAIEHFNFIHFFLTRAFQIMMPFLIGSVIAFILNVPLTAIEKTLHFKSSEGFKRGVALMITLFSILGILAVVLLVVIPELTNSFRVLVIQIPKAMEILEQWMEQFREGTMLSENVLDKIEIDWNTMSNSIVKMIQSMATDMLNSGLDFFTGIVNGVVNTIIGFTFAIYIIFQKEQLGSQIKRVLTAFFSDKVKYKIINIGRLSYKIFAGFLSGQCLEAVILGTLFVIIMSILQMPYAMLIGIVIAVTALVPIVGSFIGCAVGIFLIVMVNPIQALWFVILFLILQQLEGNLIYPKVVGNSTGLPSIWVLVAVTVGGKMFGVAGILFFIPFCSVLYALFRDYINNKISGKN